MGWWKIKDVESGRIDSSHGDDSLVNAIPGRDIDILVNGDGPADMMDTVIDHIIEEWQQIWGRKPYMEEIQAAFNFVFNALPETEGLEYKFPNVGQNGADKEQISVRCASCKGRGEVRHPDNVNRIINCPDCNGIGRWMVDKPRKL